MTPVKGQEMLWVMRPMRTWARCQQIKETKKKETEGLNGVTVIRWKAWWRDDTWQKKKCIWDEIMASVNCMQKTLASPFV